jgi:hypothetical protein
MPKSGSPRVFFGKVYPGANPAAPKRPSVSGRVDFSAGSRHFHKPGFPRASPCRLNPPRLIGSGDPLFPVPAPRISLKRDGSFCRLEDRTLGSGGLRESGILQRLGGQKKGSAGRRLNQSSWALEEGDGYAFFFGSEDGGIWNCKKKQPSFLMNCSW